MKKLLIIALLFWGCEGFGVFKHEHEGGICAFENSGMFGEVGCLTTVNEYECVKKNNKNAQYLWFESLTCEEYCKQAEGRTCTIY